MEHKASLDILVSFIPGSSWKNQFHAAFRSTNLPVQPNSFGNEDL